MVELDDDRNPVEALAEEFAAKYRQGENPLVAEYAARYPQWADEIEELFPSVIALEDLKCQHQAASNPGPRIDGEPLQQLGDYRILGELGRGGMGIVYEGEQASPKRLVAVKVVRGGPFVDDYRLRLFERETQTLGRLRHPAIASIYEAGRTAEGQPYFAMEVVTGLPRRSEEHTSELQAH